MQYRMHAKFMSRLVQIKTLINKWNNSAASRTAAHEQHDAVHCDTLGDFLSAIAADRVRSSAMQTGFRVNRKVSDAEDPRVAHCAKWRRLWWVAKWRRIDKDCSIGRAAHSASAKRFVPPTGRPTTNLGLGRSPPPLPSPAGRGNTDVLNDVSAHTGD